jgi:hypothetical protein
MGTISPTATLGEVGTIAVSACTPASAQAARACASRSASRASGEPSKRDQDPLGAPQFNGGVPARGDRDGTWRAAEQTLADRPRQRPTERSAMRGTNHDQVRSIGHGGAVPPPGPGNSRRAGADPAHRRAGACARSSAAAARSRSAPPHTADPSASPACSTQSAATALPRSNSAPHTPRRGRHSAPARPTAARSAHARRGSDERTRRPHGADC